MKFILPLRAVKKILFFSLYLLVVAGMSSCNEYNKLLKSTDYDRKYEAAFNYYDEGKYFKAFPLLEELASLYRGTEKAEKIYYYYAYCNFHLEDYELAGYHFKNFVKNYPGSKYTEEAFYMSAYTYYVSSPEPSLDPSNTYKAISELQSFINKYPGTERAIKATGLIDELRNKLEVKTYNICRQYYRTQNYKSAIVCIENAIKEFPGSKYNEELSFLTLKSSYLYAVKSIESKKNIRYKNTIEAYKNFIEQYPQSTYIKEAESIYENTSKVIKQQS